jgi:rod shape-determining protein MreC
MLESNSKGWLILVAALLCHTLLLGFPVGTVEETSVVRSFVLDTLTPLERLVDTAVYGVRSVWHDYLALVEVRRENERLAEEVDRLRMEVARNREAVMEADRLRLLLGLEFLTAGDWSVARVIGGDADLFARTITIDKGTRDGLQLEAPVMTPDGIVGRILEVARIAALVQLISDRDSAVGVIVGPGRIQGMVRGQGSRYLHLEYSDDGAGVFPGDQLITSGADQFYPKGLPVGVVVSIGPVEDMMSTAVVEPLADLRKLEEVLWLNHPLPDVRFNEEYLASEPERP